MSRRSIKPTGRPVINDRAAGIDIGARFHVVGVAPELCDDPVQTFQAFTSNIERMADWLVSIGIDTVAMESTGVYWVPVYEVLQRHGLEVIVANAREARAVPGRKSDVNDAQWLQRLHACGLLRPSFRPERDIAALRAYLRLRERHLDYAAAHIQHMQKALTLMNLQLHHVVTASRPGARRRTKRSTGCSGTTTPGCTRRCPTSARCSSSSTGLPFSQGKPAHELGYGVRIPGARSVERP